MSGNFGLYIKYFDVMILCVFFEPMENVKKILFVCLFFEGWEDFLSRPLTSLGSGHVSIYLLCTKIPMSDFHSLC